MKLASRTCEAGSEGREQAHIRTICSGTGAAALTVGAVSGAEGRVQARTYPPWRLGSIWTGTGAAAAGGALSAAAKGRTRVRTSPRPEPQSGNIWVGTGAAVGSGALSAEKYSATAKRSESAQRRTASSAWRNTKRSEPLRVAGGPALARGLKASAFRSNSPSHIGS